MIANLGARLLLSAVWLLHWLPLGVQAVLGRAFGRLLHAAGRQRRNVALRNLELCMPELSGVERQAMVLEHFKLLGRSLLERGVLWYASAERLKKLIHVEGDVHLAERSERSVMWLVPHFLAVDVAGTAVQLFQSKDGCNIYTAQSNAVLDAALRRGRYRFSNAAMFTRQQSALPMVRAIKRGMPFFNPADMDFGRRDAAFVPFFGHPAATLLAPSKLSRSLHMIVQPIVAEMLPGGQGWRITFMPAWTDWPTDDPVADAAAMNRFVETQIRKHPAQYLWVHKRFKTRPEGEGPVYD